MNILPHKSYHVYNLKNRERVRQDEEKARQEEEAKAQRQEISERERRLQILRENARAKQQGLLSEIPKEQAAGQLITTNQKLAIQSSADSVGGHINFWSDLEKEYARTVSTNPEYEAEKKAKEQKLERQYTMYFDEVLKDPKPWYLKSGYNSSIGSSGIDDEKYSIDGKIKRKKEMGIKSADDPLHLMKINLDKLSKKKKTNTVLDNRLKHTKEIQSDPPSLSTIDKLRDERLKREHEERLRTLKLLNPHMINKQESKGRYFSQFNPEATSAAHKASEWESTHTHSARS
ncbi:4783_t:CDS:2, partial [Dentiscutata erythropus]